MLARRRDGQAEGEAKEDGCSEDGEGETGSRWGIAGRGCPGWEEMAGRGWCAMVCEDEAEMLLSERRLRSKAKTIWWHAGVMAPIEGTSRGSF